MTQDDRRDDAGFSLIEVVVAMTIFVILTVAVLAVLVTSLGGVRSNAQRVQAANLAAQQIEAVRSQRADEIPDGAVAGSTSGTTIEGTTYSVVQTADYYTSDQKQSICDSSSDTPAFKRVNVKVTWPDMGSVKPVQTNTVISVGLGKAALNKGIVAISVVDGTPTPVRNLLVSLDSGATSTTDDEGCAIFTNVAPGSYRGVVDVGGYVDVDGNQRYVSPRSLTVEASKISRDTVQYAPTATADLVWVNPDGFRLPQGKGLPVTLTYPLASPVGPRRVPSCPDGPRTVRCVSELPSGSGTLAPIFPAVYGVWAGTCSDAEPADITKIKSLGLAATPTFVPPVPLSYIHFEPSFRLPARFGGQAIFARNTADPSCKDPVLAFGKIPTSGDFGLALPQGTWVLTVGSPAGPGNSGGIRTVVGETVEIS